MSAKPPALPTIGPIPVEVLATGADWAARLGDSLRPLAAIWPNQDCPICQMTRPSPAYHLEDLRLLATTGPVTPPGGGPPVTLRIPYLVFPPGDGPIDRAPPADQRTDGRPTFQLVDPEHLGLGLELAGAGSGPTASILAPLVSVSCPSGPLNARTVSLAADADGDATADPDQGPRFGAGDLTAIGSLIVEVPDGDGGATRESFDWYRLHSEPCCEEERHVLFQRSRCPVCPRLR